MNRTNKADIIQLARLAATSSDATDLRRQLVELVGSVSINSDEFKPVFNIVHTVDLIHTLHSQLDAYCDGLMRV